jgi:DNA (cytosine-5)-methyltransferase 1
MASNSSAVLLKQARTRYTQRQIAEKINVSPRAVRRWEVHSPPPPEYLSDMLIQRGLVAQAVSSQKTDLFTFIDLFAGIGGIRLGFEKHGGKCLFTSEWNLFSQKTYLDNFPAVDSHQMIGDITQFDEKEIPDHDVLLAGFPCQPFSIAGVSKKNALGRPHGFECTTQGTLFFDVA